VKEALFYKKLKNKLVQCELCPHNCVIKPGERGKCRVRENQEGKLIALTYGKLATAAIDPIEKKPLYHFHPGEKAFSIATEGCNLACPFCQNHTLSQKPEEGFPVFGEIVTPRDIVDKAEETGCKIIAYTYSEPTIAYEFWLDTMKEAKKRGLLNVWVTNGFINPKPLTLLLPYLDAANIDLKGFSEEAYSMMGGKLKPVLETIKLIHDKVHIEITTLIIPEFNEQDVQDIGKFIANLNPKIPWHISRFFPHYKLKRKDPTPLEIMRKVEKTAHATGVKHIYLGNMGINHKS